MNRIEKRMEELGQELAEKEEEQTVYVAENGKVYHTVLISDFRCTALTVGKQAEFCICQRLAILDELGCHGQVV